MFYLQEKGAVVLVRSRMFSSLPVRHGITTRLGGVSSPPYDSLNMSFNTGDSTKAVVENRRRVCHLLGVDPDSLVAGEQVHGAVCSVVGQPERGKGASIGADALPGIDCMITQDPRITLISFYADCVPLMLVDPVTKTICLAHAGWRGTFQEIGKVAVRKMEDQFGVLASNVHVVIGPSIGACCYEVSQDLANQFRERFGVGVALGQQLDLRLANNRSLQEAGVPKEKIHVSPWCTNCHTQLFFSHRASGGKTGRIATFLALDTEM